MAALEAGEESVSADRYEYCAVYVRGLPDPQHAIELLASLIEGQREGRRSVHCATIESTC